MKQAIAQVLTGLLAAVLLGGCLVDSQSTAGIEGTGSPTIGSVTAYGSIYVNGEHISTADAEIYVNGQRATEQALRLGMVVEVELAVPGDGDQARARLVRYERSLRGSVDQVLEEGDLRKVVQVLGQAVIVYDDSYFEALSFDALTEGRAIEVSGFVDAQGSLVASHLSASDRATPDRRGLVQALNRSRARFQLDDLTVDYSDSIFEAGAADLLEEGLPVRVQGGELSGATLYPERVSLLSDDRPESGHRSLEGVIGDFQSEAQFELGGQPVDASGAEIEGGDAQQLQAGLRVVASGQQRDGVLQAERLRLIPPGVERVRAPIDRLDVEAGELELMGTRYRVSGVTNYEDRSEGDRFINLRQLNDGDFVELYAHREGDRPWATRIKRLDSEAQVSLRGPVTRIDGDRIRVINTWATLVSAETLALLEELSPGVRVEVSGTLSSGEIMAEQLSLPGLPAGLELCLPPGNPDCEEGEGLPFDDDWVPGQSPVEAR